ncbi:NAD+ synthase [Candidatus Peregrinibacteria bacterium]|nr:NAD+ synthase [Candidatus Peregrinibacteria bacterium]
MDPRIDKIVEGLKDFFEKAGFKKAVLGLSGGVDSALVAKLAVMAFGKENVTALIMPMEGISLPNSLPDAKAWAEELGINYQVIALRNYVERYKKLPWNETELAHINLQARLRMTVLYHFANSHKALVLGTGNKTEAKLGYFTKYGDGAVDIAPIGNLYKTDVWKLAKELGLPEHIINKKASAELKVGQTDEGEIGMNYAEIDAALRKFESGGLAETENEKKLQARIEANKHKRELPRL